MKIYIYKPIILLFIGCMLFTSCGDSFLGNTPTEQIEGGKPATKEILSLYLGGTYQILLLDSYALGSYNAVLLMSDLRSDDIYKGGGDASDQSHLYNLSQFTSSSTLNINGLWTLYFRGLNRANNLLEACEVAVDVKDEDLAAFKADGYFMRAYYSHLLWKFWGNIPYFEQNLKEPYMTKQLSADEVYTHIVKNLDLALAQNAVPMKTNGTAMQSRVSKAAILMLKARVVLYQKDQSRYAEITKEMAEIIDSGEYQLFNSFSKMWEDSNEFCSESIFESNQFAKESSYADGWFGYGTNLPAFISPNTLSDPNKVFKGGWGFAPVREETYSIFELGDKRREGSINTWADGTYTARFQDSGHFLAKYAARVGYNDFAPDPDLNYSNNLRIFRYAETLLNYAELVTVHGQADVASSTTAVGAIQMLRDRAFEQTAPPIAMTADNIKLERRKEFIGEGMRFWDLVRWGDAEQVLSESKPDFNSSRTFSNWMKYLPIPSGEMDKMKGTEFEFKQNGSWN